MVAQQRRIGWEAAPAVDPGWQLIRRKSDDALEVLARGVLSFDVCDDGSVGCCDGRTIVHLANDAEKNTLARSKLHVDELVVLRA